MSWAAGESVSVTLQSHCAGVAVLDPKYQYVTSINPAPESINYHNIVLFLVLFIDECF